MTVLGGIGFTAPWLLIALAALPVLWLILRAVPPAPIRRRFPGVALLLGLTDAGAVSDRTPWWLMLLRMLAVALVILGLAGPVMNPQAERARETGPLLVVLDGTWAGAAHWPQMIETLRGELDRAAADDRTVAILQLTRPETPVFQAANTWPARLAGLQPEPWQPDSAQIDVAIDLIAQTDAASAIWIGDSLAYEGQDKVLAALEALGSLSVIQSGQNTLGMTPATYADGAVQLSVLRAAGGPARAITLLAQGRDPAGNPTTLATTQAAFSDGATDAQTEMVLPAELRARITRFEIQGGRSAGALTLTDDSLRRREVALIAGRTDREGLELLSPLHYLRQALAPTADLLDGALPDVLPANPDVIVLADVATLTDSETANLTAWTENGGLLLRFAGPRVAASDVSRDTIDPLMPVRLRSGGRAVGGAMSWGEPKSLAPFRDSSPFFGLNIPEDVRVSAQVMAQPGPDLAERVIADLSDGTPLVTRKRIGQGQVVLFHVTANAEWSTLPLSGLFVEMLERLAVSSATAAPDAADLQGTVWQPEQVMDGYGTLRDAGTLPGIEGPALVEAPLGPQMLPGIYASDDRFLARNVLGADAVLTPTTWPSRITVTGFRSAPPEALGGLLMAMALLLLAVDVVASLALSGRLGSTRGAVVALALVLALPQGADAQSTDIQRGIEAASEVVLAHVLTGNADVDEIAQAGLRGLSDTLFFRTSVEPALPVGVNLETDDLAFFPLLYWPITPNQPRPSAEAYARLNDYLRSGGLILFDTRDANVAGFGTASPNGRKLQDLAAPLDIPALEPVPGDHVLTRTFYLLQDFPGRYTSRDVWVEAAPPGAEQVEGMPFRNLNDGVTPVVIGGNDWAGAWAVDASGNPMLPVGRGFGGERQRELAYRFGVNLVMHVLTGNYKSDQVHVPALLDRLGQ
ncbi:MULTISPECIES: DUF4159 domain-containing protein [Roseobacteraceae]|uniref:LytTR family transcriptional regulator n=1 Tax=Pseudosulfitobacter pseudonitzschiae TaxID=1402135 RepID=A0A221K508_9RHOB|nr:MULTISPECIES: DUF4159 domain-containing protein [Roseobacteraceae]ASM74082.1 LytTR family transcriptional regulator [Pseudosulfitobacter pseudonitzschiae]